MAATFLASPIPGDAFLPPSPRHLPSRGTNMPVFTEFSRSLEKHVPVYRAKFSANGRMKIAGCFRCKFHRLFIRGYPVKTLFPVTRLNKRLICMRVEWGDPLGVETEKRLGTTRYNHLACPSCFERSCRERTKGESFSWVLRI